MSEFAPEHDWAWVVATRNRVAASLGRLAAGLVDEQEIADRAIDHMICKFPTLVGTSEGCGLVMTIAKARLLDAIRAEKRRGFALAVGQEPCMGAARGDMSLDSPRRLSIRAAVARFYRVLRKLLRTKDLRLLRNIKRVTRANGGRVLRGGNLRATLR
jgi:hypothetical protein